MQFQNKRHVQHDFWWATHFAEFNGRRWVNRLRKSFNTIEKKRRISRWTSAVCRTTHNQIIQFNYALCLKHIHGLKAVGSERNIRRRVACLFPKHFQHPLRSVVWARLPIGMSRCGLWSLWNSLIQNINNHAHYYKHFFDSAEQREICKNSSCLPTSASRSALRCLPWPVFKNTIDSAGALLFPVLLVILGAEFANSGRK